MADAFATFFHEKVSNIRTSLATADDLTPLPPDIPTSVTFCDFTPVTEEEVEKLIRRSPTKSCCLDVLPTWLLKDTDVLQALLPHITEYINASLSSGCVPDCHKTAVITPLLKKEGLDVNTYKNYRPVSNLSFVSKLLERVVAGQLTKHMSDNNLLDPLQSAYRPGHSCETAILKVKSDIDSALAEGDGVLLLLLDLSAAFDLVDHPMLLDRLETLLGITGTARRWMESYLTSRTQSVMIGDAKSEPHALTTGVPQGSVLGPLLFLAYVLPLGHIIDALRIPHHGYADDGQLYSRFTLKHVPSLYEARDRLQVCAAEVRNWMVQNKLKVNDEKTEFLIITPKTFQTKLRELNITIRVGNADITPRSCVRDLGANLDQHMNMQPQVSSVVRGMYANIRRIGKIRNLIDQDTCAMLTNSLVLTKLDYHNGLLANLPRTTLQPLQLAQNMAARQVTRTKKSDHVTPILDALHWLPVHKRVVYKIVTLVYKALHGDAPQYLADLLSIYTPTRVLRSANATLLLKVPRCGKSIGERSFMFAGPEMWNALPDSLRSSPTLAILKKNLKTYLFGI